MSEYKTVAAYFPSRASAESAISALKTAGFEQSNIGVAAASASSATGTGESTAYTAGHNVGNAWEKVKSFFGGNDAEPYAGESTKETFNDSVIAPENYDSDDLHGSLAGMSMSDDHSRYFGHRLGKNTEGAIVTVSAKGREDEARKILEENGGDVGDDASEFEYGTTAPNAGIRNLQLYGEVLRVHKDRVSRGEVRIRKEVHTTTQTVEVPVTREELVVERVPVTGVTGSGTSTPFAGEEIRIPLTEERAGVSKEAVVQEEVRVGKKEVTDVKSFDESVRNEELKIDQDVEHVAAKSN
jgi:uncharacterized protein (TIGR02271 family)